VFNYLSSWLCIVIVWCIKQLPSDETIVDIDCFCRPETEGQRTLDEKCCTGPISFFTVRARYAVIEIYVNSKADFIYQF